MRMKQFDTSRLIGLLSSRQCNVAVAMFSIVAATAAIVTPVSAQTEPSPNTSQGQIQGGAAATATAKPDGAAALRRERFRRRAAEAAQKQLEVLADQLREQLAKEIAARKAAETVAAELALRTKFEEQVDGERQRLKAATKVPEPKRANVGSDTSQLKAMINDLQRKLKAEEWARKLAEAQLKIISEKSSR